MQNPQDSFTVGGDVVLFDAEVAETLLVIGQSTDDASLHIEPMNKARQTIRAIDRCLSGGTLPSEQREALFSAKARLTKRLRSLERDHRDGLDQLPADDSPSAVKSSVMQAAT
jgi:hypothetical protein